MNQQSPVIDRLFETAEQLANDFSLFPESTDVAVQDSIAGLVEERRIRVIRKQLRALDVDGYIARTVSPVEDPTRPGAKAVLKGFQWKVIRQIEAGPLYAVEMIAPINGRNRRIGVLAQERTINNGAWMPEHHERAVSIIRDFSDHAIPIVTLIDTPGADAGAEANRHNQAHTISRLIAEMAQIHVPTLGIILGNGYSGGAIPLATTNILLSVRDGVFSTIQPRGLANIARKYDLSWQECAKFVGVSPYELDKQGYIDGIVDYVPGEEAAKLENLKNSIVSSITAIEQLGVHFVKQNPYVLEHYQRSLDRYLDPSDALLETEAEGTLSIVDSPTSQMNVFGVAYRYLRYLGLRRRISSTTLDRYGRLSIDEIPKGDRTGRIESERRNAFEKWRDNPLEIRYDDVLSKAWKRYVEAANALGADRGRVASFLFGTRQQNYEKALVNLQTEYGFHLFNLWKDASQYNFPALIEYLAASPDTAFPDGDDATVLDVLCAEGVRDAFLRECQNLAVFDLLYDNVIGDLRSIAREAKDENVISRDSVEHLLSSALSAATSAAAAGLAGSGGDSASSSLSEQFRVWLRRLAGYPRRGEFLKSIAEWKKIAFPRVSEALFAIITFLFEHLLHNYYLSEETGKAYDGRITPRNIGIKDFWNRLTLAYQDLLIQEVLSRVKRTSSPSSEQILDRFFTDVEEINGGLMTADPVQFPGFRISIEEALTRSVTPCGTITALATFEHGNMRRRVGVVLSNLAFQAGSFDMASAEKFCRLLLICAAHRLPVICFISSGGMQTKEGAGALFSMAIANDRITRFVRDNDLPVICFGFGDCTGGAQASLVTHPLASTYYFSGTNMPFAGQIVVPSHLPLNATLSNYLSEVPGAMNALVRHPFARDLDDELQRIDPKIPVAREFVDEVMSRVIGGGRDRAMHERALEAPTDVDSLFRPVRKTLVHARGCTAVKLLRVAQSRGLPTVLVQSDPDMESVAAGMVSERDALVCIGGSTPDESYLNAHSVIRIAEREGVDSLHPGIGFLAENAQFADICRGHGINFIGPSVHSMELMGNKSNAIQTARRLGVPVVPGSHGIVTDPEAAATVAAGIGFPVIIKAVHGGGGKGIRVVKSPESFDAAFAEISAEARSAFGDSDCYIEKFIPSLRHVEVQVLRDRPGTIRVLGLRDCSVQRHNQKLIEESESTMLPAHLRGAAYEHAAALADEVQYVGAGTVEFIFDLENEAIYFMEMNARLQVEHPVTEAVSGIDIVGAQFDIASGESIEALESRPSGYAIEVRINAERAVAGTDGKLEFLPDPGLVTVCELPEQEGVDVISCIAEGSFVSPYYDSLVAQIICHGIDRQDTITRLAEYLDRVKIQGVSTNLPLFRRILVDPIFCNGRYDTRYLSGLLDRIDTLELIADIQAAAGQSATLLDREAVMIEGSDELKVMAPSPGIFYTSASPSEPEFARVGDVVESDQTLCLIEAMKLFRPISLATFNQGSELYPTDQAYEIVRINPANAQPVNKGDLLFVVRPLQIA